jgi:hypothetical protein
MRDTCSFYKLKLVSKARLVAHREVAWSAATFRTLMQLCWSPYAGGFAST